MKDEQYFFMYTLGILLTILIGYSFFYIIRAGMARETFQKFIKLFMGTFKYSLDILTILFLIVFYGEMFINKFVLNSFRVTSIYTTNPQNFEELLVYLIFIIISIVSILWWVRRVLFVANVYILSIEFDSQVVTFTIRMLAFAFYIVFQTIVLLPLYSYGVSSTFGIPQNL